jgi:hypothetical protein
MWVCGCMLNQPAAWAKTAHGQFQIHVLHDLVPPGLAGGETTAARCRMRTWPTMRSPSTPCAAALSVGSPGSTCVSALKSSGSKYYRSTPRPATWISTVTWRGARTTPLSRATRSQRHSSRTEPIRVPVSRCRSGRNFARLAGVAKPVPSDGAFAYSVAKAVPDREATSPFEAALVGRALREAATFAGDATPLRHLLSSCYCTRAVLQPALVEASCRGHVDGVRLLLDARASVSSASDGKSALHVRVQRIARAPPLAHRARPSVTSNAPLTGAGSPRTHVCVARRWRAKLATRPSPACS